jgi:hypothetical protein
MVATADVALITALVSLAGTLLKTVADSLPLFKKT